MTPTPSATHGTASAPAGGADLTQQLAERLAERENRPWSGTTSAEQAGYLADAAALLQLFAPAVAVEALTQAETDFRKMMRAGYNPDIVAGMQACADLIADRVLCSPYTNVPRDQQISALQRDIETLAQDLDRERDTNRRLQALAAGRDDDHCLCGCAFEEPTLEAIRRLEASETEVRRLQALLRQR